MKYYSKYLSPLGEITMGSDGEALVRLDFDGSRFYDASAVESGEEKELPVFIRTKKWLDLYFAGECPDFLPAIAPEGTEFRRKVWEILLQIPYGKVMSYGEIAERIAKEQGIKKMSAQAVGGAVGHNPISLLVPCHRVIGKDGKMVGYGGGLDRKIALLKIEGILA